MLTRRGPVGGGVHRPRQSSSRTVPDRAVVAVDMSQFTAQEGARKAVASSITQLISETYRVVVGDRSVPQVHGDGTMITFDSPLQAELFAELLHRRSWSQFNARAKSPEEYRSFRVGIASGRFEYGDEEVAAGRLETACRTGETLIDSATWRALPPERQAEYGRMERVRGKRHDPKEYEAHRRIVVPAAPWQQWRHTVSEHLRSEFSIALGAVEEAKVALHSLFHQGSLRDPEKRRVSIERHDLKAFGRAHDSVWGIIRESLERRSKYPCWDVANNNVRLSEVAKGKNGRVWVVDGLDGSRNVAHEFPFFATTLALIDAHSEMPLIGLTYLPWSRESFFAVRGGGAYRNGWSRGSRLSVLDRPLATAQIYLEFPNKDRSGSARGKRIFDEECQLATRLFACTLRTRGLATASFALSYVAKGVFDAYVDLSHTTSIATLAAGLLLVREAGGKAYVRPDQSGSDLRDSFASSTRIFRELRKLVDPRNRYVEVS
jgi:fructose-1,6-bisphosphatase/inositol monophosphatase family enzyme/class 3 adenylate cyclase